MEILGIKMRRPWKLMGVLLSFFAVEYTRAKEVLDESKLNVFQQPQSHERLFERLDITIPSDNKIPTTNRKLVDNHEQLHVSTTRRPESRFLDDGKDHDPFYELIETPIAEWDSELWTLAVAILVLSVALCMCSCCWCILPCCCTGGGDGGSSCCRELLCLFCCYELFCDDCAVLQPQSEYVEMV